ncbi:MAG: nucleoside 2-deoxyribosyltransferase [Candidatus Paceibacterota bacterium]
MKIYFGGAIRGGREDVHIYELIIKELGNFGEVLTEHIGDKNLSIIGEDKLPQYIYERDTNFIKEADIFIADVTTPSLGVGYEIAYAEKLNKKVFCLYNNTGNKLVSFMIMGNQNCKVFPYKNKEEISEIIKSIFK